jgi:hypothetical protein
VLAPGGSGPDNRGCGAATRAGGDADRGARFDPAQEQPFYLWLAARHHFRAMPGDVAGALGRAAAARDAFAARSAADLPCYVWSFLPHEFEGLIHDLLSEIHLAAGDPAAALAAVDQACTVSGNPARVGLRAWLLCTHFPAWQDEAFDAARRHATTPQYDRIRALPAYAAYLERTRTHPGGSGWRWRGWGTRADAAMLDAAEQALGTALPDEYRRFLATARRDALLVCVEDGTATLRFHAPARLATQRANFLAFVTLPGAPSEDATAFFMTQYGISLRDLVPIAAPEDLSRAVLIHLGAGDKHGWCYRWDHEGAWELEDAAPGFDAALAALTGAIARREREPLGFLGIVID